jgi:hypothetical protein
MDIRIVQRFPCSAQKLWAITRDPAFEKETREAANVDVSVLKSEERNGLLFERVRITSRKELPGLMRSAVGADRMVYDQEMESDLAKLSTAWKVMPAFAADKVKCGGTSKIVATGPDSCERVVSGEIKVSIPLVGGKIEQGIVSELENSYAKTAEVINRWIRKS